MAIEVSNEVCDICGEYHPCATFVSRDEAKRMRVCGACLGEAVKKISEEHKG